MKHTKLRTVVCLFLSVAVLAAVAAARRPDDGSTGDRVELSSGVIKGTKRKDGLRIFKGIPFAEPPVGALRWKGPQPVRPWAEVKQAKAFGPSPMQEPVDALVMGIPLNFSEDCLYLNVWTPAKDAGEKLPVMVWFYGGALKFGSTAMPICDGTHLAEKGVVVVSVAYRVGAFGFLVHPELTREGEKGNFGLRDQIAGLEWVRDNIAAFGGDPRCVTIFGESAGARTVSRLTASPKARGLFHRAISQSGGWFDAPQSLEVAARGGEKFLASVGAKDIAAARSLPANAILKGEGEMDLVADGEVLLGDQYKLYEAGKFNDTPVLVGTNSDDGGLFALLGQMTPDNFVAKVRKGFGEHAESILAAYPHATPAEARRSSRDLIGDIAFRWHTWAWARLQSEKGKGKAFVYYFDYTSPKNPDGAGHGAEIGYVFGNLEQGWSKPRPEDVKMSDLMSSYWVNFAKTGDPNGPGLPRWSSFTAANQKVMFFDASPATGAVPNLKRLEALDAYFAWRREQAGKKD